MLGRNVWLAMRTGILYRGLTRNLSHTAPIMRDKTATSVEDYLDGLPPDRRAVMDTVLDVVRDRMPDGYYETFAFNMIWYCIPLDRFADTYNKKPLGYLALAAEKNYFSLHLMACYDGQGKARLEQIFADAGKKLDMGKACVHFKKTADLPLEQIGDLIASVGPDQFIRRYEASRAQMAKPAPRAKKK